MKACDGSFPGRVLPGYFVVFGIAVLYDELERYLQLGFEIEWCTYYFS